MLSWQANPTNADRIRWAAEVLHSFGRVAGVEEDLRSDPETVIADLLCDLMHWCDVQQLSDRATSTIDFGAAVERAARHYRAETTNKR